MNEMSKLTNFCSFVGCCSCSCEQCSCEQCLTDGIGLILRKYDLKTIFKPPTKICQILRSPKDKIPFQSPGVYAVPCSCGSSYIGETKRSIKTRLNEHIKAIQNKAVTKSAICEHLAYNEDHFIRFDQARSISNEKFYVPRIVREAIEIKKHQNFNRDSSYKLSPTWDPLINKTKVHKTKTAVADVVSFACIQQPTTNTPPTSDPSATTSTHRYNLRARAKKQN